MSSSSSSSGGSSGGGFQQENNEADHLTISPSDQLCYVQCNFCETVLAVSVPKSSLNKMVTVRCGNCNNLLSAYMRAPPPGSPPRSPSPSPSPSPPPPPPSLPSHHHFSLGPPSFFTSPHSFLEEIRSATPGLMMNNHGQPLMNEPMMIPIRGVDDIPKPPCVNRPPEKRQRVPSAYNRFIKDEIQRIKAGNPDISHREAFSAAAKNWAHFPHIHFGLLPERQPVKKANLRQQQEAEHEMLMKGF